MNNTTPNQTKRPNRTRKNRVTVSFTDDELSALNCKINLTTYSKEKFCREVLLGATVVERPPEEYGEILRELRTIGNNVYRLRLKAMQTQFIDEIILNDLYETVIDMDSKFTAAFAPKKPRRIKKKKQKILIDYRMDDDNPGCYVNFDFADYEAWLKEQEENNCNEN